MYRCMYVFIYYSHHSLLNFRATEFLCFYIYYMDFVWSLYNHIAWVWWFIYWFLYWFYLFSVFLFFIIIVRNRKFCVDIFSKSLLLFNILSVGNWITLMLCWFNIIFYSKNYVRKILTRIFSGFLHKTFYCTKVWSYYRKSHLLFSFKVIYMNEFIFQREEKKNSVDI